MSTIPLLLPLHLSALGRLDSEMGLRVLGRYAASRVALEVTRPAGTLLGQLLEALRVERGPRY
jgi:hypothetical protein